MVAKTKTKPKSQTRSKAPTKEKTKPSVKPQPQTELNELSYKQLVDLRRRIDDILDERVTEEKRLLKAKMQELAASSGFELDDLVDGRTKSTRAKVEPKYINPANKTQTWTGRGRKPLWLVAELETGKTLEGFLIK